MRTNAGGVFDINGSVCKQGKIKDMQDMRKILFNEAVEEICALLLDICVVNAAVAR